MKEKYLENTTTPGEYSLLKHVALVAKLLVAQGNTHSLTVMFFPSTLPNLDNNGSPNTSLTFDDTQQLLLNTL